MANILTEGDPRLRAHSAPIGGADAIDRDAIETLCATLAEFRRTHGFGRAIAAPQIGIARRMIAVDLGAGPFVLLDPVIDWKSDETFELWDDCFSVPDKLVRVRRHRSICLEYRDERYRLRRWSRLPAELAELIQHEVDHLDGVLMTDRALDVRPAAERATLVDAARAVPRLSLANIARAARGIDPVFRDTPQFVSEPLSARLGCRLTLKVETLNPLRCFKGRGADFFLVERGARMTPLVCASAGNFGQALAYGCRARGIELTVFAAHGANALKLERMRALGADLRLAGDDFDAAKDAARRFAAERGAEFVEDGREPSITEGAGSVAIELLGRGDAFDAILVPLGDGALLNGIARWTKAAAPAIETIGAVAAGAPAMARSWRAGRAVAGDPVDTIADGIAVRVPVSEAVVDMAGIVDDVVEVSDAVILAAQRLLQEHVGLTVEPAGAVGIAAILVDPGRFAGREIATVITGGNVTVEQFAEWRLWERL